MDGGAWRAAVHGVTRSRTRPSDSRQQKQAGWQQFRAGRGCFESNQSAPAGSCYHRPRGGGKSTNRGKTRAREASREERRNANFRTRGKSRAPQSRWGDDAASAPTAWGGRAGPGATAPLGAGLAARAGLVRETPVRGRVLSRVRLCATPRTVHFMGFSRPECWGGSLFPSPGDLRQTSPPNRLAVEESEAKLNLLSRVWLFATPWTIQPVEFSCLQSWSGQPFPAPGYLPDPGIEPRPSALREDPLPAEPPGKQSKIRLYSLLQEIPETLCLMELTFEQISLQSQNCRLLI